MVGEAALRIVGLPGNSANGAAMAAGLVLRKGAPQRSARPVFARALGEDGEAWRRISPGLGFLVLAVAGERALPRRSAGTPSGHSAVLSLQ